MKPFLTTAHKRWSKEDEQLLKETFIDGRDVGVTHKELFEFIADKLDRSPSEVQRKLIRMYKSDEDLQAVKQEEWSRDKILNQLVELYASNQPINKNSLPDKLRFTLLKSVPPSAPEHRAFFPSVDSALAEAALSCGFARDDKGLDYDYPLDSMDDALKYIRLGHKKRHIWSLDEVREVLATLNDADYPITLPFLANHYSIYKSALNVNRKLESFKDVIKKFIDDGSIKSYAELICSVAPDYAGYYNEDRSRLRLSTEEIRVKKFLDRYKISYVMPRLSDKLPTGLERFANFVPDFIILDNETPTAIVEVFGSIGDRENAGVNELYGEKTQAKVDFYNSIPDVKFIDIYNNGGRCDLDDNALFDRFGKYIGFAKSAGSVMPFLRQNYDYSDESLYHGEMDKYESVEEYLKEREKKKKKKSKAEDIESLICISTNELKTSIATYGCAIAYHPEQLTKYTFVSVGGQDLKFDSLFDLAKLTPKNKALKSIIRIMMDKQKYKYRAPKDQKDYAPRNVPFDYEAKRDHIYENTRFR